MKSNWLKALSVVVIVAALAVISWNLRADEVRPQGRHPKINHAIRALEEAKVYMEHADHDFGGHRQQVLEDCEMAIRQLRLALQADKL